MPIRPVRTMRGASLLCVLGTALAESACATARPAQDPACAVNRDSLLALNEHDFDQDLQGGWRQLAYRPECRPAAADLLRDYRRAHRGTSYVLSWHEGQVRAELGQTAAALRLFRASRIDGADPNGWNLYVDATVAFLEQDRAALQKARDTLAAIPKPADFDPTGPDGQRINIPWPLNLNVVDGLLRCFGQPYAIAYSSPCTEPIRITP